MFFFSAIKEDTVIYDGIVLMKDESWIVTKALKKLFGSGYSKNAERVSGVQSMLPNYGEEVLSGVSLNDILGCISAVQTRQREHLSGFSSFIHYIIDQKSSAKELCGKVSNLT